MSGDIAFGKCEVCGRDAILQRQYYHYGIKCECHSPNHFEMVNHCENCEPKEPQETKILLKTDALKALAELSQENAKMREALIWTSGSPSFAPEGEARKGWEKLVQPLLQANTNRGLAAKEE